MKKVTKGVVAAGLGATLLVGGSGTLAYWTESETVGGGAINSGHLSLETDATNTGCGDWTLDTGESPASTYTAGDKLVPGDVLTRDCAFTIAASGSHLRATVGISAVNFSGTDSDFGGKLAATVDALAVNGTPVTSFTDADNGKKLTTKVTVTFATSALNGTQDLSTALDSLVITATQAHAS